MNKETWKKHIEQEGIVRPSNGGDRLTWQETLKAHKDSNCKECKARQTTRRASNRRNEINEAYESVGMVKVNVNGKIFWE